MDTSTFPIQPELPTPVLSDKKATVEDIARLNATLELTKGDRKAAANILGTSLTRINGLIATYHSLSTRWRISDKVAAGETEINDVTTIDREENKAIALTEEEKRSIALASQEKKLNKSLAKLGFKSQEIEAISSVESFAGQHFQETLSIMHGSMLKSAMRLMLLAERIEQEHLQNEGLDERERKWWWDCYFRILEQMRHMNSETNKAALTRSLIDLKRKEKDTLGKPGYSTPGVMIQVNNNGAKTNVSAGQTGEPPPQE